MDELEQLNYNMGIPPGMHIKPKPKILEVSYNHQESWMKRIGPFFQNLGIPTVYNPAQKQDLIITFIFREVEIRIAIELKYQDLHSSLWGKGKGGNLAAELHESYIPQWINGAFHEVWVCVVCDNEIPFAKRVKKLKDVINKEKPVNEMMMECLQFAEDFDQLVDFVNKQSKEFRLQESLFSLCADLRIPVKVFESQDACLEGMVKMINELETVKKTSDPMYVNTGEVSQLEAMLRSYKGMSESQIELLKQMIFQSHLQMIDEQNPNVAKDLDYPWSFYGISEFIKFQGKTIRQSDAFWQKFVDFWKTGKNPTPLKEIKERLQENGPKGTIYYCHKDGGKASIQRCLKCPQLDLDGHCDYRGSNKPEGMI